VRGVWFLVGFVLGIGVWALITIFWLGALATGGGA
jgi:hypothetical protein